VGVIEKQVRKHANQKTAAPMVTLTSLSIGEVNAALRKICGDANAAADVRFAATEGARTKPHRFTLTPTPEQSHYHLQFTEKAVLIGWSRAPEWIAALPPGKKGSTHEGWWLAAVQYLKTTPDTPEGKLAVEIKLLRWLMDGNSGKLKNKVRYEGLTDMLAAVLQDGKPAALTPPPAVVRTPEAAVEKQPAVPAKPSSPPHALNSDGPPDPFAWARPRVRPPEEGPPSAVQAPLKPDFGWLPREE
jgi:hypothetical protein